MRSRAVSSTVKSSARHRRYAFDQREPHEDTHRWLVSYADFITLLFAFFVVMYSISQVNEGKYKVVSEALIEVFRDKNLAEQKAQSSTSASSATDAAGTPPEPGIIAGESASDNVVETEAVAAATQEAISLPSDTPPSEAEKREFAQTYAELNQSLRALIDGGQVEIRGSEDWIEVDIRSGLLFDSGSEALNSAAEPVLRDIAAQLQKNTYLLRIRGYTDDQPIDTERFPSNWELSSARAVSVVRMLQRTAIEPRRMAVEGFAEFAPIAANTNEPARARNRRVVIAISRFHQLPDAKSGPAASPQKPSGDKPSSGSESFKRPENGPAKDPSAARSQNGGAKSWQTESGVGRRGNTLPITLSRLADGSVELQAEQNAR